MGPGTIFRDAYGRPQLYVRNEEREGELEHLFAGVFDGNVATRWVKTLPEEWKLVNDTAGRTEAELAWQEVQALQHERDTLVSILKSAIAVVDDRAAETLRQMYTQGMKNAELISI